MNRTTVLILSLALLVPTVSLSGQGEEGGPGILENDLVAVAEVRCAGLDCVFDASGSSTGDGITYKWDSGDNKLTPDGPEVTHTYDQPGIYIVTLAVEEDDHDAAEAKVAHRAHPFGFDLDNADPGWQPENIEVHGLLAPSEADNLWAVIGPTENGCGFDAAIGTNLLAFTGPGCEYGTGERVAGAIISDPIDLSGLDLEAPELWIATMWDLQPCDLPDDLAVRCLLPSEPVAAAGEMIHPGIDRMSIQLSKDNGPWQTVWEPETADADWHLLNVSLVPYVDTDELRIRFIFDSGEDTAEPGFAGWFIDRIRIDEASEIGPIAGATAEIINEVSGEDRAVLLDGNLSITQGEQASFDWDVDNGNLTPSGLNAVVQLPPRDDDYPIELTVTDETGESDNFDIEFEVPFLPLKADASATQSIFHDWNHSNDALVVLDGSLSEGDEVIESWNWTWDEDGEEKHHFAEDPVTELTFPLGIHEIFLNITGTSGAWNKTNIPIEVIVNQVPKADATTSENFTNDWDRSGNATLNLNGNQSSDIDGTIKSWNWTWINETGEEQDSEGKIIPLEFPVGDTNVTLTVTDDLGGWNETTFQVRVNPIPTANTTGTQTLVHNWERENVTTVLLDGSESTDDRQISNWNWTWDTGDGLSSAVGRDVEIELPNGTTTISLNVTDDDGAWNLTTVDVLVNPVPIADPGNTENVVPDLDRSGNTSVILDGSESTDRDDGIVSWNWTWTNETGDQFLDLTNPVSAPTEFPLGNTTVSLNVTDDQGAWNETSFTVRVNDPPRANITNTSHDIADDGRWVFHNPLDEAMVAIELNGTASQDLDGIVGVWEWFDREDDNEPLGMGTIVEPQLSVGNHTIQLEVTDDDGHKNSTQVPIRVLENQAPEANFTIDCKGLSCTFTDESTDPDDGGEIVAWSWLLDGEEIGTEAMASHRFAFDDVGEQTIELVVTDNGGETDTLAESFDLELLWNENFSDAEVGNDWIRGGGPGNLWEIIDDEVCGLEAGTSALAFNRGDPACDYATGSRVQGHIRSLEITTLTGANEADLRLEHLREVETWPSPLDVMRLQVSTDNQNWDTIASWDSRDGPSDGWETDTIDISSFTGGSLWVRFHFDSVDDVNNDFLGWRIDEVQIG